MTLRGENIHYNTVCEDNPFYDDTGKAIASIFSYSYFRSDVEDVTSRPVIFGYNGGPGSASYMVHAGFLGAKRLKYNDDIDTAQTLPPYEVIDNPDCLLDIADVVLVDPVGTGFGVLLDDTCADKFFGIEEDAEALLTFISHWLTKYNRWGSPKYLVGESYGCTRSAVAAGMAGGAGKERSFSFAFDGVVLIGNTVTVGKYFNREVAVEPSVLQLPTCAAINWYHNHPSDQTVEEFVAEAKKFADTEYLLALYKGDDLQGEELEEFKKKLIYYSGYSEEYLTEHNYRLDETSARKEIARSKGVDVSRYDGRVTLPKDVPHVTLIDNERLDEAVTAKYGPYFHSALLGPICQALNINFDRTFVDSYAMYKKWNRETEKMNTGDYLRHAMHRNPGFRTFFANGWYDLCTQIGIVYYTATHAGLPKDRTFIKGYKSGHMIYLGEDNINELCNDIHEFLLGKDPTK
jgi:carboxypeptidase C (cathepsin A)